MNLKEFICNGGGLLLAVMTLVQIAPIEINPWSAIARAIGKAINGEVIERVGKLEKEVHAVRHDAEEQVAVNCRARILRFGDEVLHGEQHTKDHFDQILRDITSYERYCREHPEFENNVTELTSARIKEIYQRCMTMNEFL